MSKKQSDYEALANVSTHAEKRNMSTAIIIINGVLGAGKTLLMTYFLLNFMNRGMTAYTNYSVAGTDTLSNLMRMRKLSNAVVGIDDAISEGLDSYTQFGKGAMLSTKLLRYARKRDLIILFTQQIKTGIAKRVRNISNYVFDTEVIVYPYFRITGYLPNGYCWLDTGIKYSDKVGGSYDTDEEVYQHIQLKKLDELADLSKVTRTGQINPQILKPLLVGEFGINTDFANSIIHCLRDDNVPALDQIADYWGYTIDV